MTQQELLTLSAIRPLTAPLAEKILAAATDGVLFPPSTQKISLGMIYGEKEKRTCVVVTLPQYYEEDGKSVPTELMGLPVVVRYEYFKG